MISPRFTDEQIIGMIEEREAGLPIADPLRRNRRSLQQKSSARSTISLDKCSIFVLIVGS